jgi:hypothetical protein
MDSIHPAAHRFVEQFGAFDGLGVVHGFALRQPDVEVDVEREEAMRRLAPSHEALRRALGLGDRRFCTAEQVHGAEIAVVDATSAALSKGVDGLVSRDPSVCLGIYTADCGAVFLVDPIRRAIGLLHSGAKGTRLGICTAGIERMQHEFGSDPGNLVAVLSPCIRPPLYEVDFAAEIRRQCLAAGILRFHDTGACTGSDLGRYYSYRMEKGRTGRLLALLALE